MADGRRQQANGRIRWNVRMNNDLLECKKRALEWVKSDSPPRLNNGRKMGNMQEDLDLHMRERVSPEGVTSTISEEERTSLESSITILRQINTCPGWKKKGPKRPSAGESKQQKRRRLYVEKVCEIRKQISIAKAEVDRLKENRKLTKRGRRNREILHKECRTLSIASLVGYIEKKKSSLRKLKKGFVRGNKLHILSGCSALAQSKYLSRHDAALKVLFYELLYDERFIDEIPPWDSPDKLKPVYESENAKAYWDVPLYADQQEVRCNRVDACIVNHMCKRVVTLEMSCPWVNHRTRKDEENTLKYGPLRWELGQQFPCYEVKQCNIIMGALGGWPRELDVMMHELVGGRGTDLLQRCRGQCSRAR
ncbi:hypothetical protein AWC38_SpisGene23551 [Stylophora pistillata]|uniref:Uncharacterized protein n=1 Tax=Stylophora pistillata TaxID=50429 RepID=A0A2B4R802_STYPI|nr:hypothetical protein AWC38_SpisGene23551 [Stylophora pistillata]